MSWEVITLGRKDNAQACDLRAMRQSAGLNQTQAAQRLGLSLRQYQRIEAQGKAKPAIVKLAALVMP
jgi:DNA-binding XRE family transcriptional regulator